MPAQNSPTIGLGGFVEFTSAMASGRITAVQNVIDNQFGTYDPSHDFYRQFRMAITEGIANGDDATRVRRTVEDCTARRKLHYEALESGWTRWRRAKRLEVFSQPLVWHGDGLDVRVSPQLTWHDKGSRLLVWPYFKDAELSRDGIQAAIRLMEMTHPQEDRAPAVLDVRRGILHKARRRKRDFDAWLTGESAGFVSMLDSIKRIA